MRFFTLLALTAATTNAFRTSPTGLRRLFRHQASSSVTAADGDASSSSNSSAPRTKKNQRNLLIRQEGGPFAFNTKYGALNPYAIYYGFVAIALGIPWFIGLTLCQLMYFVTRNSFDKQRKIVILITHVWGVCLMTLTGQWPKMTNMDILKRFYKENRPALFVANHSSWMDIPYLGATIGWRNYKIVAKKELEKVPILGKAITVANHVKVDRSDRRSQLQTLKTGMQYLKDGVILCTFPEGTRSRNGKLSKFKNGAFKMAHKTGSPVIPLSIKNAHKVHPAHWMFPLRSARNLCEVVVHEPIESNDKSEEELAEAVRKAMAEGLGSDQRPDE